MLIDTDAGALPLTPSGSAPALYEFDLNTFILANFATVREAKAFLQPEAGKVQLVRGAAFGAGRGGERPFRKRRRRRRTGALMPAHHDNTDPSTKQPNNQSQITKTGGIVRDALTEIGGAMAAWTFHYVVHDAKGESLVVEFRNGGWCAAFFLVQLLLRVRFCCLRMCCVY
jgi:hypothetical protein